MNQLDNPLIRELVNIAINNGYCADLSNTKNLVRIYYYRGYVALFENVRGELVIIHNDFSKHCSSGFGTEIDINEFERIFSKRVKGNG
ncbi:hypothetical protein MX551_003660 [Salmonella enterica]|nr:hypothetical protein [Salmonella enterica]EJC1135188.1 hypothetical protein [Salmonella enterica]EJC1458610.1 hypothetical protein [Salmonella enterica]EKP2171078.1 hypothetical protein [Salmonella enterica]EKP2175885.1 hypothetical protein [Salmonella enterica]